MSGRSLDEPQLQELRELLDVCDDLRKIFGSMKDQENDFTIPQVVVVGNQSVGKSSLLELLSGFQLPAGTGIVTRCPIILQIRRGPQERYEVEGEEVPLRRFEAALNYAQAKLVEDSCNREVRPGAMAVDVTAKSVVCRIERPSNRDLTLVDLPGIQYTDSSLTVKIKEIIHEYIKNPAAIILLVMQCASDPTATEALSCAREVDINHDRTVCILTKPDELKEDDAPKMRSVMELVENRHEYLKFPQGVFLTKARGGSDDKKRIEEIRTSETNFFANHPYFNQCINSLKKAGHENLLNKVEELALATMKTSLPKIQSEVSRELENKEKVLEEIDKTQFLDDDEKKRMAISGYITKIIEGFIASFETPQGKSLNECLKKFEIDVIAITKECVSKLDNMGDGIMDRDPTRSAGVINPATIDIRISAFIERLQQPAVELFEAIQDIVHRAMCEVIEKVVVRETTRDAFLLVSKNFIKNFKKEVFSKLKESFQFEDVNYFSQLEMFHGPSVQQMQKLGYDFTFIGFITGQADEEMPTSPNVTPTSTLTNNQDLNASTVSLNSVEEEKKRKAEKKGEKERKKNKYNDIIGSPMPPFGDSTESPHNGYTEIHPGENHKPRMTTKKVLKRFLNSAKSNPVPNASFFQEADKLNTEHETIFDTLQKHHFMTGFRVCGNVGKLLLYHFRKKMPIELRQKLESNVNMLSESLNPDQKMYEHFKMVQSDIKQLEAAKEKIFAAMRSKRH